MLLTKHTAMLLLVLTLTMTACCETRKPPPTLTVEVPAHLMLPAENVQLLPPSSGSVR